MFPPQPSARPGQNAQQQTGSSLCREHDPLDPFSASASSMPSSGLQRKVTCCMYTACASAASDEGLQHSDVNKGLDMHTVTVWAATCNEHRARSPPRAAGTPAHTTFKAEQKPLLLLGKVWQTSYSSGSQAARPGAAGRADSLQGGRPGWQAAHLRADRRSGAFGTGCWLQPLFAASSCAPRWCTAALSCLHFTHMRGQSSVHADCLKKRWGAAYPASVTPQAGERSAHLAAPS